MASEHPESQLLLRDFDTDTDLNEQEKDISTVSLRALEDGEKSSDEFEALNQRKRLGFWDRLRMSIRRRNRVEEKRKGSSDVDREGKRSGSVQRHAYRRIWLIVPVIILSVFAISHFRTPPHPPLTSPIPFAITQNVTPIPCHSHNDYWRRIPLYDALRHGCTGVEADVWLFSSSPEELFVGHSTRDLSPTRTFLSMYIDPLVALLDRQNAISPASSSSSLQKAGVFSTAPHQTLVLLVDFKTSGPALFPIVSSHLSALREKRYLTTFNGTHTLPGPITVVATGNAPFNLLTHNTTSRDIFFDAPLASLSSKSTNVGVQVTSGGQGTIGTSPSSHFSDQNSYYASVKFGKVFGWMWTGRFTPRQLEVLRSQVRGAHERGLKARYWGAPGWPVWRRERVWKVLVEEGVDYLNGDDLGGMQRFLGREMMMR